MTDSAAPESSNNDFLRQHAYLKAVLDNMPQGISVLDENLCLRLWNQGFIDIFDLPQELIEEGMSFEALMLPLVERGDYGTGDPGSILSKMREEALAFETLRYEYSRRDGRTYLVHGQPLYSDEGIDGFITTYTDISARKRHEEQLKLADTVFAHSPEAIVITDEQLNILSVNPTFTRLTGHEAYEVLGTSALALHDSATPADWENMRESVALRGSWTTESQALRKNGERYFTEMVISRVCDPTTKICTHYIWMLSDISERKATEEQVRRLAHHDPLTGLPNRLAFLMRLNQVLPEARRHGWKVAVMFLDLDRFKIINDTLGHQIGDELLREVACRLANTVRETDMVARLGGDEFVVILPAIEQPSDAALVASKIIAVMAAPIRAGNQDLYTSPSIGISIFPSDGPDGDTILRNADTAMYHAKAAGRNNYQFYADEMNQAAAERLSLENKLRQALSKNEFALVFQPQFKAEDQRPTGVEVLIRWHHPEDGIISPAKFIPIAEETGLIVAIGEWVLYAACQEVKHWIDSGLPPIRVAVNVSARQLRRRDFAETVAGALARSGLPPELLELEITESAVMENPQEAIAILEVLQRMGVTLAIDDFGTGYSSLAYLKLFPIDHLKIDRSFVADIEQDLNDRAVAFGTIALAHSLGLNVIAEGVETKEQLELLRANGCDEIQGYLLSKPLNSAAAFALLHAKSVA